MKFYNSFSFHLACYNKVFTYEPGEGIKEKLWSAQRKIKDKQHKTNSEGTEIKRWREVMGRNQVRREELSRLQHPTIQSKDSFPQDSVLPPFHILACSSLSATNDF